MMRRKLAAIIILLGTLALAACSDTTQNTRYDAESYFPEEHQVNDVYGEVSAFGLNIAPAEEMGDWVVDWVAGVSEGDGFQDFIYSDPDSWDVYLFYPNNRMKIPMLTNDDVQVDFLDGVLNVYITESTNEFVSLDDSQYWVLHLAAYPFDQWPSYVKLYWNDVEIPCDATKYDA